MKNCCDDQLHCPLQPDRCDQTNVIYQADVHAENKVMKYYGSTERMFKNRNVVFLRRMNYINTSGK